LLTRIPLLLFPAGILHHGENSPAYVGLEHTAWHTYIAANTCADNPFAKRESHSAASVLTYKILTILTWILAIVVSIYYTFNAPQDGEWHGHTIWDQNNRYHTAFHMNSIIGSIYW
jgi:hypothetical protein